MKIRWQREISIAAVAVLLGTLTACNTRSQAQSQSQKDEETREKVADATEKAKEESKVAAHEIEAEARQAAHNAHVAAQGAKEGWDRDSNGRLDLNTAPEQDLRALGLSEAQTRHIIDGRPYHDKSDLLNRGILGRADYDDISSQVTVKSPPGRH